MLAGWLHRLVEGVGVAVVVSRFASLVAIAAVVLLGTRAEALSISGLTVAKGGTNFADSLATAATTGNDRIQRTSAVHTALLPLPAADTLGSFSEFITSYEMMVAADRTPNGGSAATGTSTSSYSITFTVNNPTGASLKIDINTLRVGALTIVADSGGSATLSLGALTGTLKIDAGAPVTKTELAAPSAALTNTASANTTFSQAGTLLTVLTNAVTSTYVLQFDWTSSATSAQQGGAIRMGSAGIITSTTADDYPGTGSRTLSQVTCSTLTTCGDGHKVDVKATIIAVVPEPETGGLLAFGVLLLALRARSRTRR
jgi:hypothetical protein